MRDISGKKWNKKIVRNNILEKVNKIIKNMSEGV